MKITGGGPPTKTITFNTREKNPANQAIKWWKSKSERELCDGLISTAAFLKESQAYRYRNAALYARLYGNHSLFSFLGSTAAKIESQQGLPADRPTYNLVQSAVDTLLSRISQNRPTPVFLTDGSDYKERNLAKKLNNFIQGEFHRTKAHEKVATMFRDALVLGTGVLKILRSQEDLVTLERRLPTELFTDPSESMYSDPRQLYETKLVDRQVLIEQCPKYRAEIERAENAYPDNSVDSSKTISDMVMVVEGWHLPSGPNAKDGMHVMGCSAGLILKEAFDKPNFPFVFLHYSERLLGFWAQGLAEQLMGTQLEINQILYVIAKSMKLVGVPRVFVEQGSKVTKANINNDIGVIVTYSGTKPEYSVAPCVPQEMYAQLERLKSFGYEQCGVSAMQASSQKPAGLNSGAAIRSYDDISTDRFASLSRRYDNIYIDLAYAITDLAKDIADDTGAYSTVYPAKDGTKEIDLPKMSLLKNDYIIQCYNTSSLPKDPAGRKAEVAEMIQAGMISVKEGRRLLDFPDLEQVEKLANASEERIYKYLDEMIEEGTYNPPDPFMDLDLAKELVVQYYNLYVANKLEEEKAQLLRDFYEQTLSLIQAATPPAPPPGGPGQPQNPPQAVPQAPPVSDLLPVMPTAAA